MKKQKKQLIGLLIVLVLVLGAFLASRYLIVDKDAVTVEQVSTEVFHIEKDLLKEVKYTVFGTTIDLVKDGDIWKKSDDMSAELDQDKVANVIGFASYLNSKSEIENPASLEEYGLDNPGFTVSIYTEDGTEKCFYIGDQYVMGDEYFAKVEGDNTVYTIADTYPQAFLTSLNDIFVNKEE